MTKADFSRPRGVLVALMLAVLVLPARAATDVALVTALDGGVSRAAEQGPQPVQSFVKLKDGDVLALDKDARLQIVYFDGGRQENWAGAGKLLVGRAESKASGLAAPQVKQLSAILVKQIARTPALDSHGRGGVTRLRGIPTQQQVAAIEKTYAELKAEAAPGDLTPDLYRLAGYFGYQDFDRVEKLVAQLQEERGTDPQAAKLVALYRKAVNDARAAAPAPGN